MKKNECRYKITAFFFFRKESFIVHSKHVFYFVTQYVIVILKTMFRALKMHFGHSSNLNIISPLFCIKGISSTFD